MTAVTVTSHGFVLHALLFYWLASTVSPLGQVEVLKVEMTSNTPPYMLALPHLLRLISCRPRQMNGGQSVGQPASTATCLNSQQAEAHVSEDQCCHPSSVLNYMCQASETYHMQYCSAIARMHNPAAAAASTDMAHALCKLTARPEVVLSLEVASFADLLGRMVPGWVGWCRWSRSGRWSYHTSAAAAAWVVPHPGQHVK